MGQIVLKKESLVSLKSKLVAFKEEFNVSTMDIKTNLENISNNWKGKKANVMLSVIESLNKTNSDLLIRIEENIEYIDSVILTIDKVEGVEVETKPTETPSPTPSPKDTTSLNAVPVISPTQQPTSPIDGTQKPVGKISFDQNLMNQLGLRADKNGNPIKVGNAYVGKINGMDYLVHIPTDNNGNAYTGLPVFIEFHGSDEAGNNMRISNMPKDRMGLRQIEQNPNFQAVIIMPQVKDPNYYASEYSNINEVQQRVISSLDANDKIIIPYGHSAGATGGIKYASHYPQGMQMFVSIDGRPSLEFVESLRDKQIPILFASSNKGRGTPYNIHINNIFKNYPTYENVTCNIKDSGIDGEVTESIDELVGTNDLKAIYIAGSSHATVRDAVINENFYSSILKKLGKQNN